MWKCYHLDDIHDEMEPLPSWELMKNKTIGEMFQHSLCTEGEDMTGVPHAIEDQLISSNSGLLMKAQDTEEIADLTDQTAILGLESFEHGDAENEEVATRQQTHSFEDSIDSDTHHFCLDILFGGIREPVVPIKEHQMKRQTRVPRSKSEQTVRSQFNVEFIIKNCLHKAVMSLLDGGTRHRNTHRLNLLLNVFEAEQTSHQTGSVSFLLLLIYCHNF